MTLFGNDLEGNIKKSIAYFLALSKNDQLQILTNPLQLPQDHDDSMRPLRDAIMNKMALHEKDRIVSSLVELGLDETHSIILVTSIISNAPTPVYRLKEAIHLIGDNFDSKYPEMMREWFDNGRNAKQVADRLGLSTEQALSIFSATQSMLNDYARGVQGTVMRDYMQEAKIPDKAINIILQVLKAYHEQWRTINQFITTQDNNTLITKLITQNDMIFNALTEILELIKGKKSGDQAYVR